MAEQMKHDKFCWRCHDEGTTLMCSQCVRSFHSKCVKNKQQNVDDQGNWQCPVCTKVESAKNDDDKGHFDMLPIMFSRVFSDKQFDSLKVPLKATEDHSKFESMVNLIDLTKIKDKIHTYTSFFELIADARWIIHNCSVLFSENHDMVKTAKTFIDYLKIEIDSFKKCAECYSNAINYPNSWSIMVCSKPHLVLWAQVKGWSYWPAKCMSIDDQTVNVRFFGDRTEADVPVANCFLYSQTNPSRSTKLLAKNYKAALEEANTYIENVRRVFGSYQLAGNKTRFDPTLLNRYISEFIPGTVSSQKASSTSKGSTSTPTTSKDSLGCSTDSPVNALKDQMHSDDNSALTQYAVHKDDKSKGSDAQKEAKSKDPLKLHDNFESDDDDDDDEPLSKRVRFSDEKGGQLTECVIDSSGDSLNESINQVSVEDANTSTANDAEGATETLNMAKCREIMMKNAHDSIKACEYVCNLNEKLQNLVTANKQYIEILERINAAHEERQRIDKYLIDELKIKIGLIEDVKTLEHMEMMTEYNGMIERKDTERLDAINEAKKQCEEDYARRLDANKKQKFCAACDTAKPQDTFFFCNAECQKRFWMQASQ